MKSSSSLKIATLNVRGFKNKRKRTTLFRKFKSEKLDIIALQETYISNETELREISTQWRGPVHYSFGSNHSKGLITLFNSSFHDNDIDLIFTSDRIILSSVKLENTNIYILNIYSPCEDQQKIIFLDQLSAIIIQHISDIGKDLVCLGDFNIALNEDDIVSGNPHRLDVREAFNNFIQSHSFTDSWRLIHPTEKNFTWSRNNPPSARRLDYIFTSDTISSFIKESNIKSIGFSDHRLVFTTFEFTSFKHGKGFYKLNASLLKDIDYCKMITSIILNTREEYNELNAHLKW